MRLKDILSSLKGRPQREETDYKNATMELGSKLGGQTISNIIRNVIKDMPIDDISFNTNSLYNRAREIIKSALEFQISQGRTLTRSPIRPLAQGSTTSNDSQLLMNWFTTKYGLDDLEAHIRTIGAIDEELKEFFRRSMIPDNVPGYMRRPEYSILDIIFIGKYMATKATETKQNEAPNTSQPRKQNEVPNRKPLSTSQRNSEQVRFDMLRLRGRGLSIGQIAKKYNTTEGEVEYLLRRAMKDKEDSDYYYDQSLSRSRERGE